jgi:small-conductance mechanosensitive channel
MENIITIILSNKNNFISAAIILGLTLFTGFTATRLLSGGLLKVTTKFAGKKNKQFEAAQKTRLKMLKRLVLLAIYFIGIASALYQFDPLKRLGTALLASAGLIGVVAGMAARSSLANVLAGLTISFAQPFRLGDTITVGEDSGKVKEITLLYTILKGEDGLIMIPNSVLSESVVKNHGNSR